LFFVNDSVRDLSFDHHPQNLLAAAIVCLWVVAAATDQAQEQPANDSLANRAGCFIGRQFANSFPLVIYREKDLRSGLKSSGFFFSSNRHGK
jgi:hypothetical protein